MSQSIGAVGSSADNALAESVGATLKREVLMDARSWSDELTCRRQTFRWSTHARHLHRHSHHGYLPPKHPREADLNHHAGNHRVNQLPRPTTKGKARSLRTKSLCH